MKVFFSKFYILLVCILFLMISVSCSKEQELTEEEAIEIAEILSIADEILQLVNEHRLSIGENPLQINDLATTLANEHTLYMIEQSDISHDDFDKRSDRLITEENASRTGENVAYGQRDAEAVMEAWLNSSGHRKNIEGDFTHIGIAAVKNSSATYYYTQIFLKKRNSNA